MSFRYSISVTLLAAAFSGTPRARATVNFREGTAANTSYTDAGSSGGTSVGPTSFPAGTPSLSDSSSSGTNGASAQGHGIVTTSAAAPLTVTTTWAKASTNGGGDAFMIYDITPDVRCSYAGSVVGLADANFIAANWTESWGNIYIPVLATPFSGDRALNSFTFSSMLRAIATTGSGGTSSSSAVSRYTLYTPVTLRAAGDVDSTGTIDQTDIALVQDAVAASSTDLNYDVNGDSSVDSADYRYLLGNILGTVEGDCNLDRRVDLTDYTLLSSNFNKAGIWDYGDFNRDGMTDLTDYTMLSANYGYDGTGGTPAPVPEPTMVGLFGMLTTFKLSFLRPRR